MPLPLPDRDGMTWKGLPACTHIPNLPVQEEGRNTHPTFLESVFFISYNLNTYLPSSYTTHFTHTIFPCPYQGPELRKMLFLVCGVRHGVGRRCTAPALLPGGRPFQFDSYNSDACTNGLLPPQPY